MAHGYLVAQTSNLKAAIKAAARLPESATGLPELHLTKAAFALDHLDHHPCCPEAGVISWVAAYHVAASKVFHSPSAPSALIGRCGEGDHDALRALFAVPGATARLFA